MRLRSSVFYLKDADKDVIIPADVYRLGDHTKEKKFSEDWLQNLIFKNPRLLPINEIEPSIDTLYPVCRELSLPSGSLDNLYVTREGHLVLVECKLWKNPEARRQVIAQIMDYAKDFSNLSYEDLTESINRTNQTSFSNPLFQTLESEEGDIDESDFVDNVSRNLRLGRHILLIVGDGIQEGAEKLADFLQYNMGLHFVLGLVEMALHELPEARGVVVVSKVVTKTTLIERGIVRLDSKGVHVDVAIDISRPRYSSRPESLSEAEFFEILCAHNALQASLLKQLLRDLESVGATYEIGQSLILRYAYKGEIDFGIGYFMKNGKYITSNAIWRLSNYNLEHIGLDYVQKIAELVNGQVVFSKSGGDPKVTVGSRKMTISDLKGKEEAFIRIVAQHIQNIHKAMGDQEA